MSDEAKLRRKRDRMAEEAGENSYLKKSDGKWYQVEATEHRAARGLYCGGGKDMDALMAPVLMESAGRAAWSPDEYFRITGRGRVELREAQNVEVSRASGRKL